MTDTEQHNEKIADSILKRIDNIHEAYRFEYKIAIRDDNGQQVEFKGDKKEAFLKGMMFARQMVANKFKADEAITTNDEE